jgi:hypothetical protein
MIAPRLYLQTEGFADPAIGSGYQIGFHRFTRW